MASPAKVRFYRLRALLVPALAVLTAVVLLAGAIFNQSASAAVYRRQVTSANNAGGATSLSLPMPSGTTSNDVIIAVVSVRGGTGTTITPPAGWTAVPNGSADSTTTLKSSTYYKVATTNEAGPYSFGFSGSLKASGVIASYSGVDVANPIDIAASAAQASNTAMVTPSMTTTVPNVMLVAMFSNATGTTFAAGTGMNTGATNASTGGSATTRTTSGLEDVLQAAAGSTGTKPMTATAGAVYVGHLVALRPAPFVSLANYRFFQNTDNTTVGAPYAASGTVANVSNGTPFRLRLNLGVQSNDSNLSVGSPARSYTLQYALRGSDNTCDTAFSGETYADVTTSSTVQFYNNPSVANTATYVTGANDPTRSGVTAVGQLYDESNPLTVAANVPAGQDALWDIPLSTSGTAPGQNYCLRIMDANTSTALTGGYLTMPEFSITKPTVTQANYRWFTNADSVTPGAALAPQDTAISSPAGTAIRLRQRLAVDSANMPISYANYKLQYATKSGTCDPSFSGESYSDINASSSPNASLPTSAINDTDPNTPWTNPGGALTAGDSSMATIQSPGVPGGTTSEYLKLTGFAFSIPAGATITGIEAVFNVYSDALGGGLGGRSSVGIVKGGVTTGTFVNNNYYYSNGTSTDTVGSSTDLWGTTWTPADINSLNFGIEIQAGASYDELGASTTTVGIDGLTIKVYYTVNGFPIQYVDNAITADRATISSTINDPSNGARPASYQNYRETDPFTNGVSAINSGSDGLWDFAIQPTVAAAGNTYCFRVVNTSNTTLDTYTQIPELTVPSMGGPTLDQQLRGGQSVVGGTKAPFNW